MEWNNHQLILGGCHFQQLVEQFGSPLFVYEESIIRQQCQVLKSAFEGADVKMHYAMKANPNPAILQVLKDEGFCIDAVSPYEVRLALETGFTPEQVALTGNGLTKEEIAYALTQKITITVDSLTALETLGRICPGGSVSLRINPGVGSGHHAHCITGGPRSKFGVYHDQIEAAKKVVQQYDLKMIGIHSHIGTGILESAPMMEAMEMVLAVAQEWPELEFIDFGGGFGIPYRPTDPTLDVPDVGTQMTERFQQFLNDYGRPLTMKLEPGRFLVAQSGVLLTTVNSLKTHTGLSVCWY